LDAFQAPPAALDLGPDEELEKVEIDRADAQV
jgi:hypothetical protein